MKNNKNRLLGNGLFYIVVFVILLAGINWALGSGNSSGSSETIKYTEFVKDLKSKKIAEFNIQPSNGAYTVSGNYKKKRRHQRRKQAQALISSVAANRVR